MNIFTRAMIQEIIFISFLVEALIDLDIFPRVMIQKNRSYNYLTTCFTKIFFIWHSLVRKVVLITFPFYKRSFCLVLPRSKFLFSHHVVLKFLVFISIPSFSSRICFVKHSRVSPTFFHVFIFEIGTWKHSKRISFLPV